MKYFKGFSAMLAREFKGYNAQKLGKDVLAGVTVAAVALPLALAFGVSSGASAAAGLVTAIVAGVVIGSLSGASFQISGPTGAMTAILVSLVARYGMQGVFIACALSGVLLILAGVLKLGDLVSFIPLPVITGFTSGIAVIIALGQVNNLTGLTSQGTETVERILSYFTLAQSLNPYALFIGAAVILFMALYPKKWSAVVPGSLAAIILATAANTIFSFSVNEVGEIPKTLLLSERLTFQNFDFRRASELLMPAVSIAALGMIESLLCGASAGRMKGEKLNAGAELIAQGIGNLVLPFFGGVPATAAIARTSVAVKAGGQTRLVSVIHSAVLLLSMFALGGVMKKIPLCALAGVLMVTAWRMNEWHVIKDIFRKRIASAMMQFGVTMACTVVFDLTVAIVVGVLFSVLTFVVKVSQMQIIVSGVVPEKLPECAQMKGHEDTAVVYVSGPLYFGSVRRLEDCVREELKGKRRVIFSMRGVPLADLSAVQAVTDLCRSMTEDGAQVYFSSLQPNVEQMLEKCGLKHAVGADRFYWSVDQAIKGMAQAPEF
ncbi:MAG TPA: SulP family inorganic anion transporter [Clostridia bacterium]|nr:SulP family inorganic anion transporter [Clostridia bacterium]